MKRELFVASLAIAGLLAIIPGATRYAVPVHGDHCTADVLAIGAVDTGLLDVRLDTTITNGLIIGHAEVLEQPLQCNGITFTHRHDTSFLIGATGEPLRAVTGIQVLYDRPLLPGTILDRPIRFLGSCSVGETTSYNVFEFSDTNVVGDHAASDAAPCVDAGR